MVKKHQLSIILTDSWPISDDDCDGNAEVLLASYAWNERFLGLAKISQLETLYIQTSCRKKMSFELHKKILHFADRGKHKANVLRLSRPTLISRF